MKNKVFIITLVIILSFSTLSFANVDLTDVLLLNSYHDGYQWSIDIKKGINDVLDEKVLDYHMRIEHMDTKNISTDEYMEELLALYKYKYDKNEFDVIISADDNALKFLLRYRDELFGDTPVFFCGVNTLKAYDLEGIEAFYGVVEKHSIGPTVEVARKHNPNLENVYLLVDNSITGNSTKLDAISDMKKFHPDLNLIILENMLYQDMLQAVSNLNIEDTIVLQTYYVVDYDGETYPLDYTARQLIKYANVPIYGIFSFAFGEGSVGGKFVEGYTQGKRVSEMVVDYLNDGLLSSESFIIDDSYNRYMFDYNMMNKYNLSVDVLPEKSIIINEPVTFYDRHSRVINFSIGIFVLLLLYVFLLKRQITVQTKKITHTQKTLMESEKMASLGRLVAGVAHEINTPIGIGVTMASHMEAETEIIQKEFENDTLNRSKLKEFLEEQKSGANLMVQTMQRASDLIQSFKRVAVDQSVDDVREFELVSYIQQIISSLRSELKKKSIDIDIKAKETIRVLGYSSAIYQVFLNLIMNSLLHGFDGRDCGTIHITIVTKESDSNIVKIIYSDNGQGIHKDHLDKIYDPFFTTKKSEGGSGLGLAIIYNIVAQTLCGTIECDSSEESGTTFTITFPVKRIEK